MPASIKVTVFRGVEEKTKSQTKLLKKKVDKVYNDLFKTKECGRDISKEWQMAQTSAGMGATRKEEHRKTKG